MTEITKYMVGAQMAKDGRWVYAEDVSGNARFVSADYGKKFMTIEAAKKWWEWAANYFDAYTQKHNYIDWSTLSVVKYVIQVGVAEKL